MELAKDHALRWREQGALKCAYSWAQPNGFTCPAICIALGKGTVENSENEAVTKEARKLYPGFMHLVDILSPVMGEALGIGGVEPGFFEGRRWSAGSITTAGIDKNPRPFADRVDRMIARLKGGEV